MKKIADFIALLLLVTPLVLLAFKLAKIITWSWWLVFFTWWVWIPLWRSFYYPPNHVRGNNAISDLIKRRYATNLGFHRSWDLLMPVVKKINNWVTPKAPDSLWKSIEEALCNQEIDWCWSAVIDFLTWMKQKNEVT